MGERKDEEFPLQSSHSQDKTMHILQYFMFYFLAFCATFPLLLIGADLGKNKNHTHSLLLAQTEST